MDKTQEKDDHDFKVPMAPIKKQIKKEVGTDSNVLLNKRQAKTEEKSQASDLTDK